MRASISNKLSKAKSSAGKGLNAVGRAGRQLGSSRSDLEDQPSSGTHVSAYAGLGPTGTAQEVGAHVSNLCSSLLSLRLHFITALKQCLLMSDKFDSICAFVLFVTWMQSMFVKEPVSTASRAEIKRRKYSREKQA